MERRDFIKIAAVGAFALASGLNPVPTELLAEENAGVLYGSDGSIVRARNIPFRRQRELAGFDDLPMVTSRNIDSLVESGHLVRIPQESETFYLNHIRERFAVTTQINKIFIEDFTKKFYDEWGERLGINSLTRTIGRQLGLVLGGNEYAASPWNSGHVRGIGTDFTYRPLRADRVQWVENELIEAQNKELLVYAKERSNRVLHTMVFPNNFFNDYVRNSDLLRLPETFSVD